MTTRRHRNQGKRVIKRRATKRKHHGAARKRHSNAGILSPIDVRTPSALKALQKRIESGPLTIVMVYADWCGHCHEMRPHFDAASQSPDRTIQSVAVNETMLGQVNDTIKRMNQSAKPISVEGYPTIVLVDHQGNNVSEISPEKNTKVMTEIMTTPTGPPVAQAEAAEEEEPEAAEEEEPEAAEAAEAQEEQAVEPESIGRSQRLHVKDPSIGGHRGGTLFSALSQSAYTLAPAAVLLATAAAVMSKHKRVTRRKSRKGQKAHTRTKRA